MCKRDTADLLKLGALVLLLLFTGTAKCQDKEERHISLHPDRLEWEESIGMKFITVTSRDDRLIYYYQEDNKEIRSASIGWDKDTRFDFGEAKKPYQMTGCFALFYCKKHLMAYLIARARCFETKEPLRL